MKRIEGQKSSPRGFAALQNDATSARDLCMTMLSKEPEFPSTVHTANRGIWMAKFGDPDWPEDDCRYLQQNIPEGVRP